MSLETKLLIGFCIALAAGLVLAVTRVLGAWAEHHITRHDLVAESKRRRLAYFQSVADRQAGISPDDPADEQSNIIIEDDEVDQAFGRAA